MQSSNASPETKRSRRRFKLRIPDWLYGFGTIVAIIALWEFASVQGWLGTYQFPPPSKLADTFQTLIERGFPRGLTATIHIQATLWRIIRGYLLATVLAIPIGIFIGASPLLDRASSPIITFARSVATISLLPLAVAWFGVGEVTRIFLITYACFWIILTSVVDAVKGVPQPYIRAAQTLGASQRQIFFQVMLPASLPRIFAGMRVALGVAFLVIVAVEMIGTVEGLGALIMEARTFYRSDAAVVGMIFIAIIGFSLSKILDVLERVLLPWASGLEEVQR